MAEYIERESLINNRPEGRNQLQMGKEEYNRGWNDCRSAFYECIMVEPASDVAPVRRGRWKISSDYGLSECSSCGWNIEEYVVDYDYCPHCGAKMECGHDG